MIGLHFAHLRRLCGFSGPAPGIPAQLAYGEGCE